jgi:hypothetical protein
VGAVAFKPVAGSPAGSAELHAGWRRLKWVVLVMASLSPPVELLTMQRKNAVNDEYYI